MELATYVDTSMDHVTDWMLRRTEGMSWSYEWDGGVRWDVQRGYPLVSWPDRNGGSVSIPFVRSIVPAPYEGSGRLFDPVVDEPFGCSIELTPVRDARTEVRCSSLTWCDAHLAGVLLDMALVWRGRGAAAGGLGYRPGEGWAMADSLTT